MLCNTFGIFDALVYVLVRYKGRICNLWRNLVVNVKKMQHHNGTSTKIYY